jgi:hypothetical protein
MSPTKSIAAIAFVCLLALPSMAQAKRAKVDPNATTPAASESTPPDTVVRSKPGSSRLTRKNPDRGPKAPPCHGGNC